MGAKLIMRRQAQNLEEANLWKAFHGKNAKNKKVASDEIARRYMNICLKVAGEKTRATPRTVSYNQLLSDAQLGLWQAMNSYDPERPGNFGGWAYRRITGSMKDGLRKLAVARSAALTKADTPLYVVDMLGQHYVDGEAIAYAEIVKSSLLGTLRGLKLEELWATLHILTEGPRALQVTRMTQYPLEEKKIVETTIKKIVEGVVANG